MEQVEVRFKSSSRPALLSIGDVARASGLATSALRYYERLNLISPAARIGGKRHYRPEVLGTLAAIRLLQAGGCSLEEIGLLLRRRGGAWRKGAQARIAAIDEHIAELRGMRQVLEHALTCTCRDITACARVPAGDALLQRRGGQLRQG